MVPRRRGAALALLAALATGMTTAGPTDAAGATYNVGHRTFDVSCSAGVGTVTADLTYTETSASDGPHRYSLSTTPARTLSYPTPPGTHSDHVVFGGLAPGNYTLGFTDPDGVTRTVLAPACGTALNLTGTHYAAYGQRVTLAAELFALQYPYTRIGGAGLRVYRTLLGQSAQYVGTVVTRADGTASVTFTAAASAYWSVRWSGSDRYTGSAAHGVPVSVRQTVGVAPTSQSVRRGTTGAVYGTVTPAVAGGYVYVQYEDGDGVWHNLNRAALKYQRLPNGSTVIGYVIRFAPLATSNSYRTFRPATSTLAHGTSRVVSVHLG